MYFVRAYIMWTGDGKYGREKYDIQAMICCARISDSPARAIVVITLRRDDRWRPRFVRE